MVPQMHKQYFRTIIACPPGLVWSIVKCLVVDTVPLLVFCLKKLLLLCFILPLPVTFLVFLLSFLQLCYIIVMSLISDRNWGEIMLL